MTAPTRDEVLEVVKAARDERGSLRYNLKEAYQVLLDVQHGIDFTCPSCGFTYDPRKEESESSEDGGRRHRPGCRLDACTTEICDHYNMYQSPDDDEEFECPTPLDHAIAYLEREQARPSPAQIFKAIGAAGFWDAADQWGTDDLAEISPVDRDAFLTALEGISE